MIYNLQRFAHNEETTIGLFFAEQFFSFSLEDEPSEVKIAGEQRIKAGLYELKERKVVSPLTEKYRKKFPWFKWHIELQDVPDRKYVYVHIGNHDKHTDSCILIGDSCTSTVTSRGSIGHSTQAYERWYADVTARLHAGERCYINITDE